MQKHITPNPNSAIFKFGSRKAKASIRNDQMCLKVLVYLNRSCTQQMRLSITNQYLALSSSQPQSADQLFTAQIQFDLKFEIILEGNRMNQKKIAIKIIKQGVSTIDLYFKNLPLLDICYKYLGKKLNQYGFHHLFKPLQKLGVGGYAKVFEVERISDKQRFAAKAFSKAATLFSLNAHNRTGLINEIQSLRVFNNHSNILKLQGVFQSKNSIYVVFQLLSDGQLRKKLNQQMNEFTPKQIKQLVRGLAAGLSEIHGQRIMHRDIKPENIMIRGKEGLQPVIVDFGLAIEVDSESYIYNHAGTPGYMAPEIVSYQEGQKLTTQSDIFSFGCVLHLLLTKRQLFLGDESTVMRDTKKCAFNLKSSFYQNVDPQAMDLLQKMLKKTPSERLTAQQILRHPYIAQLDKPQQVKSLLNSCSSKSIDHVKSAGYLW